MGNNKNLNAYKNAQKRDPSRMVNRWPDRRIDDERRMDLRQSLWQLRSIALWVKSIFKPRLVWSVAKGLIVEKCFVFQGSLITLNHC